MSDAKQLHNNVKKYTQFLYTSTLPYINQFPKLFHSKNREKNCDNTITKDPTIPQVCRYTTLWNVSEIILKIS